ncbi:AAA family ATPase [Aquibacillus sp. 3ASR75-11]|uniref:AAA family ATPase n=1 Tax=Terrihalobacillus insolitus TaxID=2950438 RepID=A0A9X3WX74_9BACI|nr:YhaN family protein [Terrihalobacillus insolitus]MDC3413531.1 AAA family ATPase [Terrihalobacillus insolitus]MDC3426183.1 AAA family ATPase [Terrihalobacillus insolitus]
MRFDYLHLEAFGHFTNYPLMFNGNKNFHILYGANEAGKSTILRSVSHLLYGFPQQTEDSFLHNNQKLRIGGQLKNNQGDTLEFIRRKGRINTVLDINGQPLDEKEVQKFLSGMSEQQFLNMFALDHVRLREGGESLLQSDGNVGESLFSAASGISVLRNVLEELENTSRGLYLKSGSKPTINQAIKEEKALTKQIAENQLKVQTWKDLEQRYLDGEKKIEALKQEFKIVSTEEMKYRRLKQTLPKIALLQEVIDKRKELEHIPNLSEQSEEIRKDNLQRLELAENKKKEANDNMKIIEKELEKLSIPEGLMEQETKIEALNREVDGYQKDRKQLPVLEGELRQLEQTVLTALKEIDVTNDNMENIDQYRISAEKKKSIRELSDQHPLLEQECNAVEKEVININKDLNKQKTALDELGDPMDVDALEQAINRVNAEGKIEERLNEKTIRVKQLNQEINDSIDRLPLWKGTAEELTQLKVPNLTNTVKKYEKKQQELTNGLQQIKEKINRENQSIEANEKRISELESLADIPTEEVLNQLRQYRDAGWLVIRHKLNAEQVDDKELMAFTQGLPLELAFENSIRESDDTADMMRREAEKVGEKNKLISDIKGSKKNLSSLEAEYTNFEEMLVKWNDDWKREWQPANMEPLTPEEMTEWLEKYEQILSLFSEKQSAEEEIRILVAKQDELMSSLKEALVEFAAAFNHSTLAGLVDQAEKTRKTLIDKESRRSHLQMTITDLKDKLEHAKDRKEEAIGQIEQWEIAWEKALHGLAFSPDTSPTVVKQMLETYDACVRSFDDMKRVEKEVITTAERMELFKEKVNDLDHSLIQEFDEMALDVVVTQVYQALTQANKDKVKLENFQQQAQQLEQDKQAAETKIKDAKEKLSHLMEQAGCDTLEELEKVEAAFKQKVKYTEKIVQLEEELLEVGNGLTLAALLEEAKNADNDLIDNELEELHRKRNDLDTTRSELEQAHGVVKKEYKEKIEGANFASVQAAEEKQSVLAKMTDLTDQYVNHKLASLLLKKGIEYYREQNQSPIMNRASEIFRRLTLHSFDGITVDFDEKDQPVIMGVRNGDEKIKVSGMSDGSTDQLYLALRIASIEKYVKENESIPFIVDDILVHFDDERSKETLKVLLELSQQTQVIFFTHHSRLIELMNEVTTENEFQQTEIQTARSSVMA